MFEEVIHIVLEALFPPSCVGCGKIGIIACEACLAPARHKRLECFFCGSKSDFSSLCKSCKKEYPIEAIVWPFLYQDTTIRSLTAHYKYRKKRSFSRQLAVYIQEELREKNIPEHLIAVPIPLFFKKEYLRGFNQATLLARGLGYQVDEGTLKRTRETPPQAWARSRKERISQIKGAFEATGKNIKGKNILLVDDVATTGATLLEAARVLKRAGAGKIYAAVLAHG